MKGNNPWYYLINNKLIKKPKPCMPGHQVHLHSMNGLYTVLYVYANNFVVMKHRKLIDIPWSDLKCHKGTGTSIEAITKRVAQEQMLLVDLLILSIKAKLQLVKR